MNNTERHITFIINPVSGTTKKKNIPKLIEDVFFDTDINVELRYTEYAGHAKEIAKELSNIPHQEIIAIGGDGTINEVANGIGLSGALMGIIPTGSGNGLARHLGIPIKAKKAIMLIKEGYSTSIDMMKVNDEFSVNVSGVGFDSMVAHKFQESSTRGLASYAKITLSEFMQYKSQNYQLELDGVWMTRKAYMISFANSSQFGNNAYIAPDASLTDGLIDVCILKPFPKIVSASVFERLMTGNLSKSKHMDILQAKKIKLTQNSSLYHLDGDPRDHGNEIEIEVFSNSLNLIIPQTKENNI